MTPFLGMIQIFGFNFAPRGWALCDGQLLAISSNTALFSLLGTIYGGDGRTTFALPELRGRTPIHMGNGPGLSDRQIGSKGGTEVTTLSVANMPSHNHTASVSGTVALPISDQDPNTDSPSDAYLTSTASDFYHDSAAPGEFAGALVVSLSAQTGFTGSGTSFNNMQPFLTLNYCIALEGVYPSRS